MTTKTNKLKHALEFITTQNKYILVGVAFLLWVSFFDQNNLIARYKQTQELHELEREKRYYTNKIKQDSLQLQLLTTDKEKLERFAREQYLMKKPNEDIFIVIEH